MTETIDTVDTVGNLPSTIADTKKPKKVVVRRDEFQLKEVVNEYIKSGLTITEYCRKTKEVAGTLVKNLEDDGYRMTPVTAQGCDELQAENDRLLNNYIKLLQKYEPDKYKMAMLACIDRYKKIPSSDSDYWVLRFTVWKH